MLNHQSLFINDTLVLHMGIHCQQIIARHFLFFRPTQEEQIAQEFSPGHDDFLSLLLGEYKVGPRRSPNDASLVKLGRIHLVERK